MATKALIPTGSIEVARILESPSPISNEKKGINPVYYGSITLQSGDEVNAYIKHIPPNEVFTEVICSLICISMGIPTPTPYLALLDANATIPTLNHGDDPILFATSDAQRPSFKAMNKSNDLVYQLLEQWTHTPDSAVFDEQIGNQDRHGDNILMDAAGNCSLIDHGLAFDRNVWATQAQQKNTFVEIIAESKSKKTSPLQRVTKSLPLLQKVDFDLLLEYSHGRRYADEEHIERIRAFYDTRLNHIRDIFDLKLGKTNHMSLPI